MGRRQESNVVGHPPGPTFGTAGFGNLAKFQVRPGPVPDRLSGKDHENCPVSWSNSALQPGIFSPTPVFSPSVAAPAFFPWAACSFPALATFSERVSPEPAPESPEPFGDSASSASQSSEPPLSFALRALNPEAPSWHAPSPGNSSSHSNGFSSPRSAAQAENTNANANAGSGCAGSNSSSSSSLSFSVPSTQCVKRCQTNSPSHGRAQRRSRLKRRKANRKAVTWAPGVKEYDGVSPDALGCERFVTTVLGERNGSPLTKQQTWDIVDSVLPSSEDDAPLSAAARTGQRVLMLKKIRQRMVDLVLRLEDSIACGRDSVPVLNHGGGLSLKVPTKRITIAVCTRIANCLEYLESQPMPPIMAA